MVYPNLTLPNLPARPYYFSNFVSTIDGKVQVTSDPKAYWPIGSETDYVTLIQLRTYADALIHGKNTALWHRTFDSLAKPEFLEARKELGKGDLLYVVISGHPDDSLIPFLDNPPKGVKALLATTTTAKISKELEKIVKVVRFGTSSVDLHKLSEFLFKQNIKHALVEGGPHLMGSFCKAEFLDELFVTIAPKIFGNEKNTLTMVEGFLFPPKKVPSYKLVSMKQVENELYLRYKVKPLSRFNLNVP